MRKLVVTKEIFIPQCLKVMKRLLENELPKEAEEPEMIVRSYEIVHKELSHIKSRVEGA